MGAGMFRRVERGIFKSVQYGNAMIDVNGF